jgi:6-pyruvoyltetrahydropterin/6-carboxytetrahydropterin synthase
MFEIQKSFYWEMGHRVSQHGGKCFSPHGHSYKATIYCRSTELNKDQMVIDFGDISKYAQPIIDKLDHAFMVYCFDEIMLNSLDFWENHESIFKSIVVPFESTAENIAKYIYDQFVNAIKEKINMPISLKDTVSRVVVWETPKCAAEYRG